MDTLPIGLVLGYEEQIQYQQDSTRLQLLGWRDDHWVSIPAHFEQLTPSSIGGPSAGAWLVLKTNTAIVPDHYGVFAIGKNAADAKE
ncbi:MAG: hypothetical protein ACKOAY_13850 [Haliscomenobacter sp.]